jgi:hypothetical protein
MALVAEWGNMGWLGLTDIVQSMVHIEKPENRAAQSERLLCYAAGVSFGSAWDPVILPVFKTGARRVRPVEGVFDSHTLPPYFFATESTEDLWVFQSEPALL